MKTTEQITYYLTSDELFNTELMNHDKVRDLLIHCRDELEQNQTIIIKLVGIIKALLPEKYSSYFICGEAGQKDVNNLPDKLLICPQYGSDVTVFYKKENNNG